MNLPSKNAAKLIIQIPMMYYFYQNCFLSLAEVRTAFFKNASILAFYNYDLAVTSSPSYPVK